MIRSSLFAILVAIISVPSAASAVILEPGFEKENVGSGFVLPVAMAFAPDGRIFIAEKGGTVRVIKDGAVLPTPVITLTDVNTFGDRGLLGIAVDPQFSANGYLYLSYTYENTPGANVGGEKTGRIARVTVIGDVALESSKVVLVGTVSGDAANPSCEDFAVTADCIPSDSPSHSVGGLRFGPDGKLYATLGDGAHFDYADPRSLRAQNIDSLAGKLLRINTDGTAPSDNPFFNGDVNANRSKVYALGLRNAFRLNFDPTSGALYVGDVGWSDFEEVNRIIPGGNYGWPCIEGTVNTSHGCTPSSPATAPLYAYAHDASGAGSVTMGAFGHSNAYPDEYDTSLFVGDYAQNWIKRVVLDAGGGLTSVELFDDSPDGPVDISTGLDGSIYFLSIYTGELTRLTHTTGNRRPVVVAAANPSSGILPLAVSFSSAGTYDPDGDALSYAWDFGDGAVSNLANPVHTYTSSGAFDAVVSVADANGATTAKSITITAGNQAPTASIVNPASGSLYVPFDIIDLDATAFDLEDGELPASAFHWTIILHHNTHIHIEQEFFGTKSPSFVAPDHTASDVYVEVRLEVTDSAGLVGTQSVNLYLNNGSGAGNLIANPSLEIANETSGQPLSWHQGWWGNLNAVFTYPVAGYEGSYGAELTVSGHVEGDAKWYFDPVFVTPGSEYVFSNMYTASAPTTITAQFGLSNGTYQYQLLAALPATATPTRNEYYFIVPEGVQTAAVFHQLPTNGTLTVDDYSLMLRPDSTPPAVTITTPISGSSLYGTTTVEVSASDDSGIAGVTLSVNGIDVSSEDTSAPYSFVWDAGSIPSTVSLTARARDVTGNIATSSPVEIVIDPTPNLVANPDLEIEAGSYPAGWQPNSWGDHSAVFTYPVVGWDGGKAARVEITNYPDTGSGDAKWFFTKIPVTPGEEYSYSDHFRSSTISDIIGQYTRTDGTFHYFGLAKEIAPSATWNTVNGTFVPPADATHVTFFHLISSEGFLEIDDVVLQKTGGSGASETNPPIVEFTNPLGGDTISGTVTLTASSTDDTAVTYVFYAVDGTPITGQIATAPYSFAWDTTTVANGQHTLKVTTHDPFGNNSTHTISVTVANGATAGNLIANPSLETPGVGGNPDSWLRGGWGTNTRTFTYPVAGIHGADAARVEISSYTNGDAKWYFQDVAVTGGVPYLYSEQFKSTVATEVLVRYTLSGGATQYQFLGALPAAASWTSVNYTITPPAGTVSLTVFHVLHAVGSLDVDNFSLAATSAGDTTAPAVAVAVPTTGSSLSGNATIDITATDNVGVSGVTLILDGTPVLAEDTTAPYSFTLDTTTLTNGAHTLAARARDAAGNVATSTAISVTVSNVAIANLILNPSLEAAAVSGDPEAWLLGGWGTNTRTFTYPVAGIHGADAARVEISSYTNGDAKWYFQPVAVTPGTTYALSHKYKSSASTELLVRYTLSGGSFQYAYIGSVSAAASWTTHSYQFVPPAGTTHVTLFHVLHSVGTLEIDDFSLTVPVADTAAPSVAITMPTTGSSLSGNATIDITATDNVGVSGVTLILDGTPVLAEDTTAPYSFTLDTTTLTNGAHTLAARARDAAGNVATSTAISVTVSNVAIANLILNPSLETPGTAGSPANWNRNVWGTNTTVFTYPVAGNHGASAARIEMTSFSNGDAKWRFTDVPVTPGVMYSFRHDYRANVTTNITARYTMQNGSYQYVSLGNMPASATWQTVTQTLVVPAGATSLTIFHILNAVGYLETDAYELFEGNVNQFGNGMVSFTFDDGWISQYTAAAPILDAANMDGTFFIVSQETLGAVPQELVFNPSLEDIDLADEGYPTRWHPGCWGVNDCAFTFPVAGVTGQAARVTMTSYSSGDAKWWYEDVAVIPGQSYRFEDSYRSDVTTELVLQITHTDDSISHVFLGQVPASDGAWARMSIDAELPADARLVSLFHILAQPGYLTIDDASVKRVQAFVDVTQMLEMQSNGHDIAAHTRTHADLALLPDAQAQIEIEGSRAELLGAGALNVSSIAYPFGSYDLGVQQMVSAAGFSGARSTERGFNTKGSDRYNLKIQSMNRTTTLAELQAWIAQAMAEKTWLVLMFHQIDGDLTQSLGVTEAFFQESVDAIATSGIEVVTVHEGLSRMNP